MLAHCAYNISAGKDCVLRPPEEYVLNVCQIALTAQAQGLGKGSKDKMPKELPPTVVLVSSKNLVGEEVTSAVCTLLRLISCSWCCFSPIWQRGSWRLQSVCLIAGPENSSGLTTSAPRRRSLSWQLARSTST